MVLLGRHGSVKIQAVYLRGRGGLAHGTLPGGVGEDECPSEDLPPSPPPLTGHTPDLPPAQAPHGKWGTGARPGVQGRGARP